MVQCATARAMCQAGAWLVLLSSAAAGFVHAELGARQFGPAGTSAHLTGYPSYATDEEYIRHIHWLVGASRSAAPLLVETNASINTKYRTWKRNADIINSLLSLPKGMNDAGR